MPDETRLTAASRLEKLLDNIAGGDNDVTPATRLEKFLSYIADAMEGGGSGGGSGGGAQVQFLNDNELTAETLATSLTAYAYTGVADFPFAYVDDRIGSLKKSSNSLSDIIPIGFYYGDELDYGAAYVYEHFTGDIDIHIIDKQVPDTLTPSDNGIYLLSPGVAIITTVGNTKVLYTDCQYTIVGGGLS